MNKPVKTKEKKRGKPFLFLRNHAFELLIFSVVLLSQLWIVFIPSNNLLNWFFTDDAFYYYKVAQNIGEGKGSTFEGVNLTNGYHPLWMLICIPVFLLARYNLILPLRHITLVCYVLTSLTGFVLFMLVFLAGGEFSFRERTFVKSFPLYNHGLTNTQFDINWFKLQEYLKVHKEVDTINYRETP